MEKGLLVAVVDLIDDASEDHWAQAGWIAELAAREAALKAGYAEGELTAFWQDWRTIVANTPDGQNFAATVNQRGGGPYFGAARQPSEREQRIWNGLPVSDEEPSAQGSHEAKSNIDRAWVRLREHEGEIFKMIRGNEFSYTVGPWYLTLTKIRRNIERGDLSRSLDVWPVDGPGNLPPVALPSHTYAILSDERIRGRDW